MDIRFIASFAVITSKPADDRALFVDALGLPLAPPEGGDGAGYVFSQDIEGCKHFGVWPLTEAAQACFGTDTWPDTHPVPQATIEFEVDDVAAAAAELSAGGHTLVHDTRTEPWGQVIARLQSADGALVGVCFTPWLHGS
jgi:catechol 2,3-dioxygenase-like lactoylglutathione lyase family enzyme